MAVRFLTIIPFGKETQNEEELARSTAFFPIVGLMIGGILLGCNLLFNHFLYSFLLSSLLTVGLWAFLTGCIHIDGLCDTVDGLFGAARKEKVLEIMEEPYVGAMGVFSIVCLVLLKTLSLANLAPFPSLLIAPMMGRLSMVTAAYVSKPAKSDGLGKQFVGKIRKRDLCFATFISVVAGVSILGLGFLFVMVITLFLIFAFFLYFKRKTGGFTGDILGALCEVVEVATLLVLCLRYEPINQNLLTTTLV